jgi:DNA repair protein RecO (recombination protein O)
MVKGISSRKGSTKYTYFQPLYIFDLELYHYENRELHNLKELNLSYIPRNIPGDIRRSSIAMFMGELLNNIIREEDVNLALYTFIESSVISLDEMAEGISNFHLWFLVTLTAYAGIGPSSSPASGCYFDMLSGQFTSETPMNPDFLEPGFAALLNSLLKATAGELADIHLTGEERTGLLNQMVRYYQLHLPGIRHIKSLQVLKEIFR